MTILTFVVCSLFNVFPVDRGNKKQIRFVPALSITIFIVNDKAWLCLNHQWTLKSVSSLYCMCCTVKNCFKHLYLISKHTKIFWNFESVTDMLKERHKTKIPTNQMKNFCLESWIKYFAFLESGTNLFEGKHKLDRGSRRSSQRYGFITCDFDHS